MSESIEVYPDLEGFEDCKVTVFRSGLVYIDHEPVLEAEAARRVAEMLREFAEAVENFYQLKKEKEER